jgi:hypothetical protein
MTAMVLKNKRMLLGDVGVSLDFTWLAPCGQPLSVAAKIRN